MAEEMDSRNGEGLKEGGGSLLRSGDGLTWVEASESSVFLAQPLPLYKFRDVCDAG